MTAKPIAVMMTGGDMVRSVHLLLARRECLLVPAVDLRGSTAAKTLRASLAPLAAPPSQPHPPCLPPRLRYPMVVWEGEAQKGGFGGGTLATAPPSLAPPPLATASPPLRW